MERVKLINDSSKQDWSFVYGRGRTGFLIDQLLVDFLEALYAYSAMGLPTARMNSFALRIHRSLQDLFPVIEERLLRRDLELLQQLQGECFVDLDPCDALAGDALGSTKVFDLRFRLFVPNHALAAATQARLDAVRSRRRTWECFGVKLQKTTDCFSELVGRWSNSTTRALLDLQ